MTPRLRITIFWGLVALMVALGAAMSLWSVPRLEADAGGPIFDMRGGGYGLAEARAYLTALSPEGTQFYLRVQHRLDLPFPALFGVVLAWSLLWATRDLPRWIGTLLAALALFGALADYAENGAVAQMLRAGAEGVTAEQVAAASRWTITKSIAWGLAALALLQLLIWRVWMAWRRRVEGGA